MNRKKVSLILIVTVSLLILVSCGFSDVKEVKKVVDNQSKNEISTEVLDDISEGVEEEAIFSLGDTVVVDDLYYITILGVTETDDRNQFSEKEVSQVLFIDYMYENLANSNEDIYISDSRFKFIDEHGNMGYTYPAGTTKYPQETVKGAKTTADMAFGTHVDGDSIILCFSDNMFNDRVDVYFLISDIK